MDASPAVIPVLGHVLELNNEHGDDEESGAALGSSIIGRSQSVIGNSRGCFVRYRNFSPGVRKCTARPARFASLVRGFWMRARPAALFNTPRVQMTNCTQQIIRRAVNRQ